MSLISSPDLKRLIEQKDVILLDASMPPVGIDLEPVQAQVCIPGARRFDIEAFSDTASGLPHTILPAAQFEEKAREIGLSNGSKVVVYDNVGMYSAPRAWWNLVSMGVRDVAVLDGGLKSWLHHGYEVDESHAHVTEPGSFNVATRDDNVVPLDELSNLVIHPADTRDGGEDAANTRVVDVRSAERYWGMVAEPRAGLRRGHIPSSVNIPFTDFYASHSFKDAESIKQLFCDEGLTADDRLVFSCGSGVTACIGILAAKVAGFGNLALYDGSWAEWGGIDALPIASDA